MAGIIEKFSRSWQLAGESLDVLRSDTELLVLPVLSGIATAIVAGFFWFQMNEWGVLEPGEAQTSGLLYGWLFGFYLIQYFVVIFFNTALVGAALIRLDGGDPTIRDALGIPVRRLGAILGYAILSATVGILLRIIADRAGFLGRIFAGLAGLAWSAATYLVVPVIAAENLGPVDAIDRSVTLLRKSWGESLIGNAGVSLVITTLSGGVLLIGVLGSGGFFSRGENLLATTWLAAWFVPFILLIIVGSALSSIYGAAVYYYAASGNPPDGFDRALLRDAFLPKAERSAF
jgi:hypothetical protein